MSLKIILWVYFLFHLQQHIYSSETEISRFSKNFTFISSNNIIVFFDKPALVYEKFTLLARVECHRTRDACEVIQEAYTFNESSVSIGKRICSFNYPFNKELSYKDVDVIQFGYYRILVNVRHFGKRDHKPYDRTVYVIRMSDCHIRNIDIKMDFAHDPLGKVMPRQDGKYFDIFYTNFELCNAGMAKKTYDDNGNMVTTPDCIMDYEDRPKSVLQRLGADIFPISNEQYFLLDRNGEFWTGYAIKYKDDSYEEVLDGNLHDHPHSEHRISTGHGHITVCWLPVIKFHAHINCSYANMNTYIENKLQLKFPYVIHPLEVHNLPNDELLVVTRRYNVMEDTESIAMRNYDVWRFRRDGSRVGEPTTIQGLSYYGSWERPQIFISESSSSDICISFQCTARGSKVTADWTNYYSEFAFSATCLTIKFERSETIYTAFRV